MYFIIKKNISIVVKPVNFYIINFIKLFYFFRIVFIKYEENLINIYN